MLGGGTGPATGTNATTCSPGPWHLERMLAATDLLPMNFGFLGKGNAALPDALREQLEKMRNKEARREERAQQAAQQSVAEGEADKAE